MLGFYVEPGKSQSKEWLAVARRLTVTLAPGKHLRNITAGERTIGAGDWEFNVTVPHGWIARIESISDPIRYRVFKLNDLEQVSPWCDLMPLSPPPTSSDDPNQVINGKILGQAIDWNIWSGRDSLQMTTAVRRRQGWLSISCQASRPEQLAELRSVVETLR